MKKYSIYVFILSFALVLLFAGCQKPVEGDTESSDSHEGKPAKTAKATETPDDLPEGATVKTSGDYAREIDRILDNEDYDTAYTLAKEALEKDPDHRVLQMHMGICLNQRGEYEEAVKYFTESLENGNGSRENYMYRGQAYTQLGKYDEAIKDFDIVLKILKDFFPLYNSRGIAYISKGDIDKGMADFNKAVELNTDNESTPFENRGMGYIIQEKYDKAAADLNRSLEINPDLPKGRLSLAMVYILTGKNEKGMKELNEAVKTDPDVAMGYYIRGYALLKDGNKTKALEDFETGREKDENKQGLKMMQMLAKNYSETDAGKMAGEILGMVDGEKTGAK